MDDVAKEAGLSKGTLYWYYKSKDDIIFGILHALFDRELAELDKLVDQVSPAKDRLETFIELTLHDMRGMMKVMPIFYDFIALAMRKKTIQLLVKKFFRRYLEIIIPIIQQGIDSGEFKTGNATDIAIAIGAIIEGTILLTIYDSETVDLETHLKNNLHLLLNGLIA
jgi:AcrR family transcriptional regulator